MSPAIPWLQSWCWCWILHFSWQSFRSYVNKILVLFDFVVNIGQQMSDVIFLFYDHIRETEMSLFDVKCCPWWHETLPHNYEKRKYIAITDLKKNQQTPFSHYERRSGSKRSLAIMTLKSCLEILTYCKTVAKMVCLRLTCYSYLNTTTLGDTWKH